MKFSAKTVMITTSVLFVVFIIGIFVGGHLGASVPIADISPLMPTELPLTEIDDEYAVVNGRININTADADVLSLLPGVSYNMATKIIEYRSSIGKFEHIDQLLKVDGFGEKRLENISNYISVGD